MGSGRNGTFPPLAAEGYWTNVLLSLSRTGLCDGLPFPTPWWNRSRAGRARSPSPRTRSSPCRWARPTSSARGSGPAALPAGHDLGDLAAERALDRRTAADASARWWLCIAAALPAHVVVELLAGSRPPDRLAVPHELFEALVAAAAVRHWSDEPTRFDTLQRALAFVGGAVLLGPFVSSSPTPRRCACSAASRTSSSCCAECCPTA